ncbi:DUF4276 family protein [Alysiella filiformis]|nr:DUF4276 family protein [Alysiella filiformis]
MNQFVFFLEEKSAEIMLNEILPKILPEHIQYQFIIFEGKQDLEKRLPKRLKGWLNAEQIQFVVLRDKDSGNCLEIKENLKKICIDAGKPNTLIRIACHELESFYLGDLQAVARAFGKETLRKLQQTRKFKNPDELSNPVQELDRLVDGGYQKISGSRKIAPFMDIENNRSTSFNQLLSGIRKIANLS